MRVKQYISFMTIDTHTYPQAGGLDWLTIWRDMYDAERRQGEAATDPALARSADTWAGRASRYAASAQRTPQPDSFLQLLLPRLRPSDTVMDVGAGTGRYLPLLSRHVARVIAVEPSAAMRAELGALIAAEGLTNVEVVEAFWPAPEPLRADVIISAHVVYGVREIGPFLAALDRAANRACYLYVGLRHPSMALAHFWKHIHGEARLPLPCALETMNALYQMGIFATLELVPISSVFRFSDEAEALHDIRIRLHVAPDPARDAAILGAMATLLVRDAEGFLVPPDQLDHAAVIGWER